MAKTIEENLCYEGLSRTVVVVDNDGKIIKGVRIYQEPNESEYQFYKTLESKIYRLRKKYPGMRIEESTAPNVGAMVCLFPELFRPRTS